MQIIKLSDVSKSYGENVVFNKVHLDINAGEKVGIIGANGTGKSTLIKMIMGLEEVDSGKIEISEGASIGYLKQATEYSLDDFIQMSSDKNSISDFLKLTSQLNISSTIDFTDERLQSLSGGEKTKIALSSILAKEPNVLLLDEPTNHMDIDGVEWLINRLKSYKGTLLVVSHDRYFLNEIVKEIVEVEDGSLKTYFGNYDDYQREKEKELERLKARYEKEQKQEKKITKEINQLKKWSEKGERESGRQGGSRSDAKVKGVKTNAQRKAAKTAKAAEGKKTRLEQMKKDFVDKPKEEKEIKFDFNGHSSGANTLVRINDLSMAFDGNVLFDDVNLVVNSHEKIGLVGPNGSGKTTLIKLIMGELKPDSGEIWKTPSLKIAYMSQDVFDLNEDITIFEMGSVYDNEKKQFFFSNLVNMGFDRSLFRNKVKTLSLGQRMRIKLVQIILNDYNLLVLDEPTNHLDLDNKIELERALESFPGSIIIASHDKYLLSKVTNKVFVFENGKVKRLEDSYSEYMEKGKSTTKNMASNFGSLSVTDKMREIEDQMADPSKTESEINELLEVYYELLAQEDEVSSYVKRRL